MKDNSQNTELTLVNVLGDPIPREAVLQEIQMNPKLYEQFMEFPKSLKEEFLAFCEGVRGVKITYDPFFKKIFSPKEHPERLEAFLECILEQPVKIVEVLSREGMQLIEKGSFVVMDIIVSLQNGSLVNVEMQKVGYKFPAERSECYASDMTMRQYSLAKNEKGKNFKFHDIKPVILIVIMESSPKEEFGKTNAYVHKRMVSYDTGIELPSLHNIRYITLDIFKENVHNISTDMEAWLRFLSTDKPEEILELVRYKPIFAEMYHDMAEFRREVKEVMWMYSEALKIMDLNTERYMIDEWKKELEEQKKKLKENNEIIEEQQKQIKERAKEIEERDKELEERDKELEERDKEIEERDKEIEEQKQALEEKNRLLEENAKRMAWLEEQLALQNK